MLVTLRGSRVKAGREKGFLKRDLITIFDVMFYSRYFGLKIKSKKCELV